MTMMPKKLKQRWIKALRSGEYGQTREVLTDGKGNFCCLGVLQHVASRGKVECLDSFPGKPYYRKPSVEWYESNGMPNFSKSTNELMLMWMNDRGEDFATIANWIEKHIKTY